MTPEKSLLTRLILMEKFKNLPDRSRGKYFKNTEGPGRIDLIQFSFGRYKQFLTRKSVTLFKNVTEKEAISRPFILRIISTSSK